MSIGRSLFALMALFVVLVAGFLGATWAPDVPVAKLVERYAPPPSKFAEVQGLRLHLRDEGPRSDPVPIVLVHGTSSSLHTWDAWADVLSQTRRVIRFDLPGFGLTGPRADGQYTISNDVAVLIGLLDALKIERVVLAGNSLGGRIAWTTAVMHPARVERLVLVDAAGYPLNPTSVPIGFKLARIGWLAPVLNSTLPRGVIESSTRNVYGDPSRVSPELVDRYYEMTLRAGNRRALGERLRNPDLAVDRSADIARITQPTLIIWGSKDRLIPPENAARFHADIAGSELVMLDGLGHVPMEEDPAASLAPVLRFLQR